MPRDVRKTRRRRICKSAARTTIKHDDLNLCCSSNAAAWKDSGLRSRTRLLCPATTMASTSVNANTVAPPHTCRRSRDEDLCTVTPHCMMTSNSVNANGIVCATSDCTVSETVLGVDVFGTNHASSKKIWQCGRFIATALINLLFAVGAAFAIGRAGRAHQTTRRSSLPTMRDLYFTAVGKKMLFLPRRATSLPKAVFVAAVLLLAMCGFDSAQAATCAGDATMVSSTVLLCNGDRGNPKPPFLSDQHQK